MAFPMPLLTELCFRKRLVGYIHAGPFGPLDQPGPRCLRIRQTAWVRRLEKPVHGAAEAAVKGAGPKARFTGGITSAVAPLWRDRPLNRRHNYLL
jgi:hypothetical protein